MITQAEITQTINETVESYCGGSNKNKARYELLELMDRINCANQKLAKLDEQAEELAYRLEIIIKQNTNEISNEMSIEDSDTFNRLLIGHITNKLN